MGVVYKAEDVTLHRFVAPATHRPWVAFQQEARAAFQHSDRLLSVVAL